jgi:Lon-like ATP-dependent protease
MLRVGAQYIAPKSLRHRVICRREFDFGRSLQVRTFFNFGGKDDDDYLPFQNADGKSSSKIVTPSIKSSVPTKIPFGEASPRQPHTTAIPLVSRPLFPGLVTSLTLTDEATIDTLENLWKQSQEQAYVSCFLRSRHPTGVTEGGVILSKPEVITDPSDLFKTGAFAQIQRLTRNVANPKPTDLEEEQETSHHTAATVILLAHRRVDLVSVDSVGPPIDVTISHWPRSEYTGTNDSIRALSNEIISTIREVAQMNPLFRENLTLFPMRFDANDPFKLADFAASITASSGPEDLQAVLEEKDPEMRLHKALVLVTREKEVSKLQKEISAKVEEKMTEAQRKYFLTEQLKSIKKELGMERDDKDAIIDKYREKLAQYTEVPKEVMETIDQEIEKFSSLEKNSPEYNVTRSYLDWLVGVPWGVLTNENFDIKKARKILDRDHYGLDDVKDTILQFIAIGKLKGTVHGKILCLSGPPGTGVRRQFRVVCRVLWFRFLVGN